MTIRCDFGVKMVTLPEEHGSVGVELYLFDTAGQSVFNQRQLAQKYWENASAVMAVYDVSNRDSFTSLNKWLNDVMTTRPGRPIPGVVVANKSDLRDVGRLAVSFEEGENFARQHGLAFKIASAMNAEEAEAPFRQIAQDAYKRYRESLDRVTRML